MLVVRRMLDWWNDSDDGRKITTADEWRTLHRPEVLELFRKQVYGRVPATPYAKSFKVVHQDPKAIGGAATLRRVQITISRGPAFLTISVVLFIPNRAPKSAPAFLLICNRGPENFDPTRERKSEFWPTEEAITRGYAIAAFHNADVDPDKDDGFKDGIHGLLDDAMRSQDAWGAIDDDGYRVCPEPWKHPSIPPALLHEYKGGIPTDPHVKNLLDCVKSRQEPNAPVEVGHNAVSGPHLANIALRTQKRVTLGSDGVVARA